MTATGLPQRIALEVLESLKYHEECGCAGFFFLVSVFLRLTLTWRQITPEKLQRTVVDILRGRRGPGRTLSGRLTGVLYWYDECDVIQTKFQ